jgi:PadR family transcriptional regulator
MARKEWTVELKKGTVQLGILALLAEGKRYGFDIIEELRKRTGGYLDLKEGTLYPALHRMEKQGLLASEWVIQEGGGSPRKYYVVTPEGRASLERARADWATMVSGLAGVLKGTPSGKGKGGA